MREITRRKPLQLALLGIALLYITVLLLAPIITIVQKALANGFEPVVTALSERNVIHALQVTFVLTLGAVLWLIQSANACAYGSTSANTCSAACSPSGPLGTWPRARSRE